MTILRLLDIDAPPVEAEAYMPDASRIVDGHPQQRAWNHYTDPSGCFSTGVWESEVGTWRIRYTEEEYCELLRGVSIVTDAAGHAVTLRQGDRFVIPRGFEGTWQVVEPTRKVYVIYEAAPPGRVAG